MRRAAILVLARLLAAPAFAVVAALSWAGAALHASLDRHDWGEMDWDGDGRTTLAEAFEGAHVGRRDVQVRGRACTELFAFKDGRPLRVDCPG
jgi:hypothetical protein